MSKIKAQKNSIFKEGEFTVSKVAELNFFDLLGNRSHTLGTSSKFYTLEIQVAKIDSRVQIYTSYGPTGFIHAREYRVYSDLYSAEKDFNVIVKSKLKKGYQEIDLAQRANGSEEAKKIIKPVILSNLEIIETKSNLHIEIQRLVSELFNITNNWVITNLKCPLGQLTNTQIDKGRSILENAKSLLDNNSTLSKTELTTLQNLTNDFYTLIPHNLGQGARGQLHELLFDDKAKIAQKNDDLDLLLDAKAAGASLTSTSTVEEKYKTLNSKLEYVNYEDPIYKWIDKMFHNTRASNHHFLGKIKVHNIFKISRQNEEKIFLENAKIIAKTNPTTFVPPVLETFLNRPDINKDEIEFYRTANVLPVWHGTRRANIIGINMKGLLIRPSGVVLAGSCFGNGIYFASNSSKSINYSDANGSYWANGTSDRAFIFLCDVAFGNPKLATGSYKYTKENIIGYQYHSVYAQAKKSGMINSGMINDELIIYNPSGPEQQHALRYIIEFETKG